MPASSLDTPMPLHTHYISTTLTLCVVLVPQAYGAQDFTHILSYFESTPLPHPTRKSS